MGVLTDDAPLAAILVQGLRDAGWKGDGDVEVLTRAGADGWTAAARELAARRVDVLVAGGHAAARAAHEATASIPIVAIDFERDPITSGFVQSLARPGGNVTGFFCDFAHDMHRLALAVRETLPAVRRAVVLVDGPGTDAPAGALRAAAAASALEMDTLEIGGAAPETLVDHVAGPGAVLVVLDTPRLHREARRLAKRALRRGVPSAGAFVRYAQAGGLLARGPSLPDAFRRAAAVVDRLLRGGRAAEVALERPPRYELIVNLKTAGALHVVLPPALMSRADHIVR